MEALYKALSEPGVDWETVIRLVLVHKDRLEHGRDYTGQGTMEDPIVFAAGLEYYDSFARLCEQMGLDRSKRILVPTPDGRFLDAVPDPSGVRYYFLTPIPGSQEKG